MYPSHGASNKNLCKTPTFSLLPYLPVSASRLPASEGIKGPGSRRVACRRKELQLQPRALTPQNQNTLRQPRNPIIK